MKCFIWWAEYDRVWGYFVGSQQLMRVCFLHVQRKVDIYRTMECGKVFGGVTGYAMRIDANLGMPTPLWMLGDGEVPALLYFH